MVVTGDLSQSLGSPVERGKVLFEVAPLDAYRVVLQVDERDIADVAVGQHGELLLAAAPDRPLAFTVEKITPVSTAREGRNYFRVEAQARADPGPPAPGMEGVGKIAVESAASSGSGSARRSTGCGSPSGPGCRERHDRTSRCSARPGIAWRRSSRGCAATRASTASATAASLGTSWRIASSERFYRFSPAAYLLIGLMDGTRTVQQIWDVACDRLGDDAPTQDEVIQLLAQLHAADVLQCDVTPDAAELFERPRQRRRRRVAGQLLSFFSWRIPLVDPEAFLRAHRAGRCARSWGAGRGVCGWPSSCRPPACWPCTGATSRRTSSTGSSPRRAWCFWLLFPVIKALHELGHAVAVKACGGEVHDMGMMMLVVTPVPYVDASAAWAFPDKRQRMVVGAAGMLVELFIAAIAVFVWLSAEPGLVRTVAFATILIAGISTLLFNANPLLRFDGYYILSDWLEIPNLWSARPRCTSAISASATPSAGRTPSRRPATAGERAWFVLYGVTSFAYRLVRRRRHRDVPRASTRSISRWSSSSLAGVGWVLLPAGQGRRAISPPARACARSARGRSRCPPPAVALGVYLVGIVPVPYRSRAEGVIWIPEESFVRARADGFIRASLAHARRPRSPAAMRCSC